MHRVNEEQDWFPDGQPDDFTGFGLKIRQLELIFTSTRQGHLMLSGTASIFMADPCDAISM